jgi:hypothetical protein
VKIKKEKKIPNAKIIFRSPQVPFKRKKADKTIQRSPLKWPFKNKKLTRFRSSIPASNAFSSANLFDDSSNPI